MIYCMKSNSILFFLVFIASSVFAQDIYNLENSRKYADYLYMSHEYKLASQEYERVVFLDSTNEQAKLRLISSYRHLRMAEPALSRLESFYPEKASMPSPFANEYSKLLIHEGRFERCLHFLADNRRLQEKDRDFYKATVSMYHKDWQTAYELLSDSTASGIYYLRMRSLANQAMDFNYKKPWISMGLSTVVPGLGKIYSGYWKDGLVSLVFVGLSAWQSYRGFERNGVNSAYGWIYGGLSLGFYIGNIYGSGKAANKYNYQHDHKIIHEVENIYINY